MNIHPYEEGDAERWDELVGLSPRGTFLHTRRFLSYHGGRFEDCSVVCRDDHGRIVGVFPAALKREDPVCVLSHPGATYGGLLMGEAEDVDRGHGMLAAILRYYSLRGLRRLEYKSVPPHLHAGFSQSDVQAIWRLGGELTRRDLWNVLTLDLRPDYSSHHRRAIDRARKQGVAVETAVSDECYRVFHAMVTQRLGERYETKPAHTLEELLLLRDRFPKDVSLWLSREPAGRIVAGTWVFMFGRRAWHTQYIAATAEGRELSATHLLFDGLIQEAQRCGVRQVSFGCSSEDEGRRLNPGLFAFKAGFGSGTVCHDFYRLTLS